MSNQIEKKIKNERFFIVDNAIVICLTLLAFITFILIFLKIEHRSVLHWLVDYYLR